MGDVDLLRRETAGPRRWWLLGVVVMGAMSLLVGVGALVVMSRLSGGMEVRQGDLERSVGHALERDADRIVIELTGEELTELLADSVGIGGLSVADLAVRVEAAGSPQRGRLHLRGRMGSGGTFRGTAAVEAVAGQLRIDMEEFELRGYRLPGIANTVAGDLLAEAASIEPYLDQLGMRLREVTFAEDRLRVVVADRHDASVTPDRSDPGEADRHGASVTPDRPDPGEADRHGAAVMPDRPDPGEADRHGASVTPDWPDPGEADRGAEVPVGKDGPSALPRVPSGTAGEPVVDGDPMVLVVGDSVAAGVGADDFADSYAARVHGWLQRRDKADYGLRNLAVPGETSWSLREDGQLDRALAALDDREAALIIVDIGANDVLLTLDHPACEQDVASRDCRDLIERRLADFPASLDATLADLGDAAPDTPVVVVTTYNPFSFGGATDFERRSDEVVDRLNRIIGHVGSDQGARIADGATPLRGRAAELTHMAGDGPPDVHLTADGYDELAAAVIDALRRPAPAVGVADREHRHLAP